jgi:hypothetical protein
MRRRTRISIALVTLALLLLSALSVAAQTPTAHHLVAYFTDYRNGTIRLLRYDLTSRQISIVSDSPDTNYTFSNNKQRVAIWNKDHLWLSDLAIWNPTLLVTKPGLNIGYIEWTPDDSRLLLFSNYGKTRPFRAFDLRRRSLLNWKWDRCDTYVQNVRTLMLGILCSVDNAPEQARVFLWGGSVPFAPDQFRLLTVPVDRIGGGNYPYWVNQGRTLGYAQAFNSEAPVSAYFAGHLFFDVASQSRREPTEMISGARSDNGFHFALSPDGTLGAFIQDSGGGNYHSIHIFRRQQVSGLDRNQFFSTQQW